MGDYKPGGAERVDSVLKSIVVRAETEMPRRPERQSVGPLIGTLIGSGIDRLQNGPREASS